MAITPPSSRLGLALLAVLVCLGACSYPYFPNHHLVHPHQQPDAVVTWAEDVERDQLQIHLEGARPAGGGPFPAVLVHPEGGKRARDMQGVIWDLAAHGYVAIAADYRRFIDGHFRWSLFPFRSGSELTAAVEVVRRYPEVSPQHIGALGFSQGGVFSLLLAAHAPDRIKAVVSYYPVTDFPYWLREERPGWWQRRIYAWIRWFFRRESGAQTDAEFQDMLRRASPYYAAESIQAPVLLVHGDRDTTAPVEESQRMADRLAALGKDVTLMVVPGAVHIFNFRQLHEAALAWEATLEWLAQHLQPARIPGAGSRDG